MGFFEKMVGWSWKTRIMVSAGLFFVSFLFLLGNRIWPWGWVVGVLNLLVPFIFREQESVFDVEIEEVEFDECEFDLKIDEVENYFLELEKQLESGFDEERALKLVNSLLGLQPGQIKMMEYNVRYQATSAPFRIHAKAESNEIIKFKIETQEPVTALVMSQ
ncbi:MAG: hypothetical protein AAFX93_12530 [Verrucomicrobiota bacterium]